MPVDEHWSGPYLDDRMYVMRITTAFRKSHDGSETGFEFSEANESDSIDLESLDSSKPTLLITYRNVPSLPATRVDDFPTLKEAIEYVKEVEPTCPRVGLDGEVPNPTPSWQEHLDWLHELGLRSAAEGDDPASHWLRR